MKVVRTSTACNYNPAATIDDGSCLHVGDACDDGDSATINDVVTASCECAGTLVGIEESELTLNYFPNPANDKLTIQLRDGGNMEEVQITDLQGRVVFIQSVRAGSAILDLQLLPAGRYLLMVKSNKGTQMLPLAIMR